MMETEMVPETSVTFNQLTADFHLTENDTNTILNFAS
jgi:hypothetical protein